MQAIKKKCEERSKFSEIKQTLFVEICGLFVVYCRLFVDCTWIVSQCWHTLYEDTPNFELPTMCLRRIPVASSGPAARRCWPPAPCAAAASSSIASRRIHTFSRRGLEKAESLLPTVGAHLESISGRHRPGSMGMSSHLRAGSGRNTFFLQLFLLFPTKGEFFPDPLSFSPHDISEFRVCHETRRGV